MTQADLTKELLKTIKNAIDKFDWSVSAEQDRIVDDIESLLSKLERNANGNLSKSVKNLSLVQEIKQDIAKVIKSDSYKQAVADFNKTFTEVAAIQERIFVNIKSNFKPSAFQDKLKEQAQRATVRSLTGAGLKNNVAEHITRIVKTGVANGGKYATLIKDVRKLITTGPKGEGILQRYTKQITTDGINQYSRNYTKSISDSIGQDWFMYVGAIVKGSRAWCRAMVRKKYFHKSELPDLLHGDFPEFHEENGKISDSTDLPTGMIEGTNIHNIFEYCGGYQCNHQIMPVADAFVPLYLRQKFTS